MFGIVKNQYTFYLYIYLYKITSAIFATIKIMESCLNSRSNLTLLLFILSTVLLFAVSNFLFDVRNLELFPITRQSNNVFHPIPPEYYDSLDNSHKTHDLVIRKSELEIPSHKVEAVNSVHIALEMKKAGKYEKAMKIIEHSYSLAPRDPDILNAYGEFLEDIHDDIIGADQKYYQALKKKPDHENALTNRQRTSIIVDELDKKSLQFIDEKRDKVSKIPESNIALCRAKKEAYIQHIYHTVGIEGNTMTLSQTRSIVETRMAIGGKSIAEHNEILGLDCALKYINSTLIDKLGHITTNDILEIHRRVYGYVDPMESGTFRRTQVFVGGHVPPGPNHIPILMDEFTNWLNSEKAYRLHPVQIAALAHYKLVHIHPFIDGNGRTARLLMNMILMRAGFPPVIIPKQERHRYYEALELANEGDIRPFIRFIAECTEKTLDIFLWSTVEYSTNAIPALESDAVK